jgi:hypothetical protein
MKSALCLIESNATRSFEATPSLNGTCSAFAHVGGFAAEHHTTIPWSPERMRRLIFSSICSSSKASNRLKPTSLGINSSQISVRLGGA